MASNLLNPWSITNNLLVNNQRSYFKYLLQELYTKQFLRESLLQEIDETLFLFWNKRKLFFGGRFIGISQ